MSFSDDWWSQLSPEEQDMLLSEFGSGADYEDAEFASDYGTGGLDFGSFDFGGVGYEGQPAVDYFTTKGDIDPTSRTEEAGRVNLLQDYGALSVDNILTGYAGAGAYDPSAFTPTYDYGEPLNMSGRRKAESLAGAGGWQGFVTDLIFKEGMSPAEAEAELYEAINTPDDDPDLTDQDRAMKQSLIESMPPSMETDITPPSARSGATPALDKRKTWDTDLINQFTTRVWSDLMEDPEFKYQDPETGQYYDKTPEEAMVKTPQMEKYDAFGIPYPTESYEDPEWVNQFIEAAGGPSEDERAGVYSAWDEEQQALSDRIKAAQTGGQGAHEALMELSDAWGDRVTGSRPQTEFDVMMDAFKSGEDQMAARDEWLEQYGPADLGAPGGPSMPQVAADREPMKLAPGSGRPDEEEDSGFWSRLGDAVGTVIPGGNMRQSGFKFNVNPAIGLGAIAGGSPGAVAAQARASEWDTSPGDYVSEPYAGIRKAQPPNVLDEETIWSTLDDEGNRIVFDFDKPPENQAEEEDSGMGRIKQLFGGRGKRAPVERLSRENMNQQTRRRNQYRRDASRLGLQRQAAQWSDPRLAGLEAMARAYALNRSGQTPFRDAMATRNANARAMLSGRG